LVGGKPRERSIQQLRDYELVTIVRPDVSDEDLSTVTDRIGQWVGAQGGEVTKVDVWGRRRMAYPIRDFRDGNYVISQIRIEPKGTGELERSLKLSEDVLRYLLVRAGG
jgi:small subunit ribosomal protein S6